MTHQITFGSVCSGIEAASVAWHPLGWRAAWLAEIEKFPSAVLAHHYPDVPNLGDMTKIAAAVRAGLVSAPDILVGGTPCQSFSVAGLRGGISDPRGALTLAFVDLANAIDTARTVRGDAECVVTWENVPGVLSSKDNAFGCFLAALAGEDSELEPEPRPAAGKSSRYWKWDKKAGQHAPSWPVAGCVFGPQRTVAWRVTDAQYFGVAQRRRRVFVVASARKWFDPTAVLFELEGVRRDTAPSREVGQNAAADAGAGHSVSGDGRVTCMAHGQAGAEIGDDRSPTLTCNHEAPIAVYVAPVAPVAPTLQARTNGGGGLGTDFDCDGGLVAGEPVAFDTTQITSATNRCNPQPGDPCHPLAAGAHAPAIAFQGRGSNIDLGQDVTGTIGCNADRASGGAPCIAFPANLSGTQCASSEELSPALGALNPTAVAFSCKDHGGDAGEISPTLLTAMQVRRLTPRECERLQSFPDDYTLIPWGRPVRMEKLEQDWIKYLMRGGVMTLEQVCRAAADGPRYKALGNSMCVYNMAWIGRRIAAELARGGAA